MNNRTKCLFVVCFLVNWLCSDISARPINSFRLGYPACISCHVSPSGGGVLSDYGKSIADEISSFSYEGMGRSDYGVFKQKSWNLDKYVNFGGNIRNVLVKTKDREIYIPMQKDIELAVKLSDKITIVGSYGVYGKEQIYEIRRYYALVNVNRNFNLRAGRFIVNYGILRPDHTNPNRRNLGFDQGSETYNAELSFMSKNHEIFLTGFAGEPEDVVEGHSIQRIQENGVALKYSFFPLYWLGTGISGLFSQKDDVLRRQFGMYYYISMAKKSIILGEVNYKPNQFAARNMQNVVSDTKLQTEHLPGLHTYIGYELANEINYYYSGFQIFPVSHMEIDGRMVFDEIDTTYQLLFNYYL